MTNESTETSVASPIERAAEHLLAAWRSKYKRARGGIHENAPLRDEFSALAVAVNDRLCALSQPATSREAVVIDLEKESFKSLCEAAGQSSWMPPEYMANDWLSDCAEFLRTGRGIEAPAPAAGVEPLQPRDEIRREAFEEIQRSFLVRIEEIHQWAKINDPHPKCRGERGFANRFFEEVDAALRAAQVRGSGS